MKYKLIAIDMDGTLLNSNKEISDRTIQAITKAKNKGINVVLATGRILSSAQIYADRLNLNSHILACNGAIICDGDKNVVHSVPMGLEAVEKVISLGEKYKTYFHFYNEKSLYSNQYVQEVVDYYSERDQKIDFNIFKDYNEIAMDKELNIYKFLFIDNDLDKLSILRSELDQVEDLGITKSWSNNIEVMNKDVSKGLGLKHLCNLLNISSQQVIAIGDNENDISMIDFAGLGVAMGNGSDIVKSRANYITSTNDEDGVANVIEKFIF